MNCSECGDPFSWHGDRAVAACMTRGEQKHEYDYMASTKCFCEGYRPSTVANPNESPVEGH